MDKHADLAGPKTKKAYGAANDAAITAYATILQVRDRITADWQGHQKLTQAVKEQILGGIDALGKQGDLQTTWVNNVRGRIGEAMFGPHGGLDQVSIPNPEHPAEKGGEGRTRPDDYFNPGKRPGSTSDVREWVEIKTDLISGKAGRRGVNADAVGTARAYARDSLADRDGLLSNAETRDDRLVMQFARKPGDPATQQAMLDVLFGPGSAFSAVRFGDDAWIERPADKPLPPIPAKLQAGPTIKGRVRAAPVAGEAG
jgi:hypothetical protein